ncbi:GNAT family N-acetyltransferase [Rubrivirga sp. IMCC45206]|uniref:GNAT family N-acetyltransferase n=1 Tax=Rubrivirga sp. IMCC45206 TaxID=3391614 RepID=UPI00398FF4E1
MQIRVDDLTHPAVVALVRFHRRDALARTPSVGSAHALGVEALRRPEITLWTAWDGDDVVGCAALHELDAGHGEVKSMRTAPAFLRRGVAAALLARLLDEAEARGYARVSLETGAGDGFVAARALYRRFGFVDCGPFADYPNDPQSVWMTLALPR